MDLIGQEIRHKTFGPGVVTGLSEGIVTVCFQNMEKRFIYPDAFNSFLVLDDRKAQQSIEKHIGAREMEAQKVRELQQAERDKRQKLLNYKIAANSHAVFDIPSDRIEQVISSGRVSTGTYLSGYSKGMPRVAERIKPNSVCLLTTCAKGQAEQARSVIGAFMVAEDFFGGDADDGIVKAHAQHRMLISKESQLPFWEYFGQDKPPVWGNKTFKYCSENVANRILVDLTQRLADSGQEETAIDFYKYFCKINGLSQLIKLEDE